MNTSPWLIVPLALALVLGTLSARGAEVFLFSFFRDNGQDGFYVYFDHYVKPQYYGAAKSGDLVHWQDISDRVSFPKGARHGTVLRVPENIVQTTQGKTPER